MQFLDLNTRRRYSNIYRHTDNIQVHVERWWTQKSEKDKNAFTLPFSLSWDLSVTHLETCGAIKSLFILQRADTFIDSEIVFFTLDFLPKQWLVNKVYEQTMFPETLKILSYFPDILLLHLKWLLTSLVIWTFQI